MNNSELLYEVWELKFIFSPFWCPTTLLLFVEKTIFPPLNCFCIFVNNLFSIFVWALCSIPMIHTCIPPPGPHSLLLYYSCIINIETRWTDSFHFILLFSNLFLTEVELICNIMSISNIQYSDSVFYRFYSIKSL